MPAALPRAPEWICALTAHLAPPISDARYTACSGLYATPPRGMATPKPARSSLAWYSWISTDRSPIGDERCALQWHPTPGPAHRLPLTAHAVLVRASTFAAIS